MSDERKAQWLKDMQDIVRIQDALSYLPQNIGNSSHHMARAVDSLRKQAKDIRQQWRRRDPEITRLKERFENKSITALNYTTSSKNGIWTAKFCNERTVVKDAYRYGGDRYEVRIGCRWAEKVYANFYNQEKDRGNRSLYLILQADQYRVNAPKVKLYEVIYFEHKTKEVKKGFIGQTTLGKMHWMIKPTAREAILAASSLGAKAVTKELLTEPERKFIP